jgi:hypothetical protein
MGMVSLSDASLPGSRWALAETGTSSSNNGRNRKRNFVFKATSREMDLKAGAGKKVVSARRFRPQVFAFLKHAC